MRVRVCPTSSMYIQDLNRIVHSMQTRVASLIEHCSDEIVLESTLVINDDLNTLFVRYERWLKNSAAAKSEQRQDTLVSSTGVATTNLIEVWEVCIVLVVFYISVSYSCVAECPNRGRDKLSFSR